MYHWGYMYPSLGTPGLHGYAIACALKQTFAQCKIFLKETLIRHHLIRSRTSAFANARIKSSFEISNTSFSCDLTHLGWKHGCSTPCVLKKHTSPNVSCVRTIKLPPVFHEITPATKSRSLSLVNTCVIRTSLHLRHPNVTPPL